MRWFDAMPRFELAQGVPVRDRDGGRWLVLTPLTRTPGQFFAWSREGEHTDVRLHVRTRVDLDDHQGFAYALRHFAELAAKHYGRERFAGWENHGSRVVWERHMAGETTDDDRLELANALRLYTAPRELRRYHKDASWCLDGDPCERAHLMPLRRAWTEG